MRISLAFVAVFLAATIFGAVPTVADDDAPPPPPPEEPKETIKPAAKTEDPVPEKEVEKTQPVPEQKQEVKQETEPEVKQEPEPEVKKQEPEPEVKKQEPEPEVKQEQKPKVQRRRRRRRPKNKEPMTAGQRRRLAQRIARGAQPHTDETLDKVDDLKAAIKAARPSKYKLNLQTELKKLQRDYYHPHHDEL